MDGESNPIMPRPIDYMEPSFVSSVADETSVHHNIDNIIVDSEVNSYYKNPEESYYGKPYKYYANLGEERHRMSIPLNMAHYADIIEKTNLSKSLSPVIEKYLPGHGESIERNLINKLRKGDVPGGLVAYYEPYHHSRQDIGGYYSPSRNTTSPDTMRILADAYRYGSTTRKHPAGFEFAKSKSPWSDGASGRYGSLLHEPIHGIKFPREVAGMKYMDHTDKAEGFSQWDYRNYVKEMAENFKSKYGGEILRRQLNRLFKGKPEHKESVMVQDVFDDLFPDDVIHEKRGMLR